MSPRGTIQYLKHSGEIPRQWRDFPLSQYPNDMRCISCINCWAFYLCSRLSTMWWWVRNRFILSPTANCFSHDSQRISAPRHSIATSCRIALHGCVKPWLPESWDKGEIQWYVPFCPSKKLENVIRVCSEVLICGEVKNLSFCKQTGRRESKLYCWMCSFVPAFGSASVARTDY